MSRLSCHAAVVATGAAVLLLHPSGAAAQTLSGRVTVLGEQLPEPGAVVTVLDSLSQPVESLELERSGGFVISLPGPGTYSVVVSLSGHSTLLEDLGRVVGAGRRVDLDLMPLGGGGVAAATDEQIKTALERSVATSCGDEFDPAVDRKSVV